MISNATSAEPSSGACLTTMPKHISPTAAKSYLGCSLRFYFERVACIEKKASPALRLGKPVHAALHSIHLAR